MKLQSESLPQSKSSPLRSWLEKSEFDILVEVLESRAFRQEYEAVHCFEESNGGMIPDYQAKAVAMMVQSDNTRDFIKLLKEFRSGIELKTYNATPN